MKNYTITTIKDTSGDSIATGAYINAKGDVMPFDYCGPYTGLKQALEALRDDGAEVVHRVETLPSINGWLAHEVQEAKPSPGFVSLSGLSEDHHTNVTVGFALQSVWGNVRGVA